MSDERRDRDTSLFDSSSSSGPEVERFPRRGLLKVLGGAAGVAAVTQLTGLSGCGPKVAEPPPVAEVPLASLPEGERVRVMMGVTPIEVTRTGDEVTAHSLWCTHLGCEVKWNGERKKYFCPCHEGVYNAKGFPISGPPPRPLDQLQVTVADGVATITTQAAVVPPAGP
ncbi:MAG: ubiquinol-cytochrome c reductase iron-sulfur subunit [Thermoanaerobaculia bacterium]